MHVLKGCRKGMRSRFPSGLPGDVGNLSGGFHGDELLRRLVVIPVVLLETHSGVVLHHARVVHKLRHRRLLLILRLAGNSSRLLLKYLFGAVVVAFQVCRRAHKKLIMTNHERFAGGVECAQHVSTEETNFSAFAFFEGARQRESDD